MRMSESGITVKKSKQFSEWYTQVVLKSELADYAPIKGCIVFREHSYAIWEKIQDSFNKRIEASGHKNVYFPLFIPESFLRKEAEHFKGFVPECAWVTVGGDSELEERLAVRPTSETIMYVMYRKWIKSWRDLPLKLNQWCNIVRWETKATKPFLRTREFLWQEGHTAHATKEEADKEVMDILEIYKDLMEEHLAIPVLVGKKTESEKFAGALYTTTLEALMPDGKVLQLGTSHNLGQNFSKPFKIKFVGKDEKDHYVWQTSWGISTRLIGALVMVHGDDKGLVLPPKKAPCQVVIVPIFYREMKKDLMLNKAREIFKKLEENGIATVLDDREEYTPGWKFNQWELKGVPIRIEIGPKDIEKKQVIAARRDTFERIEVKEEELMGTVDKVLKEIQENLFNQAKKFLEEHITSVETYAEFKKVLRKRGGFIRACWCSNQTCEEKIKDETGATIRLIPFEKEGLFSNCVYCGDKAKEVVYFARAY
ncbi:MAG: proline--tRNA ligase [Candidatus Bathyarchaeota archaeon]|nr:proline--tRNA ligase [Candidatus Bathyarchaeota archaeon]MDH5418975.1 proline--tRNA ligase [Candidatus Bathyarchaeota archaeon]MDH5623132.1 proline--tRNA ligase [Candidatus Bathyarchaeota archaeon]MDH5701406.1 proline--tRNA ligase [Candidatus Bathyarchaeota archaeon]